MGRPQHRDESGPRVLKSSELGLGGQCESAVVRGSLRDPADPCLVQCPAINDLAAAAQNGATRLTW
jgi:hypothetical protein